MYNDVHKGMIMMDNTDYLSISINDSFIRYALFDESGNLKVKKRISTPTDNIDNFLKKIYEIVNENQKSIYGIGLSVPGQVDQASGVIYHGGSVPMLHGLSLGKIISGRYDLPVAMENTGVCSAIAAQWTGNLKDVKNGAVFVLGDGVTSGIILNHQLFSGAHLQAGGIGMMLGDANVEEHQPQDLMFNACSATKMVRAIGTTLELAEPNDETKVFKAIENGDANARELFNAYCRNVAYMIANVQAVLDLDKYVISGGISTQSILVPEINHQLQIIHDSVPLLKEALHMPTIETSTFKQDTDLYGAYYYALEREQNRTATEH
jgi:predicted NBD/HSP70 family sugar kinase